MWYHVDDMKISHVDSSVVHIMIVMIKQEFGKDLDVRTVHRGILHNYLGI